MKKSIILFMLLIATFTLFADKFLNDVFESNTIVVGFKMEAIGNINGTIDTEKINDIVHTNIPSFNNFAQEFSVIDLIQDCPEVMDKEWNDNGIYIQNLYKIKIKDNSRIEDALDAIRKDNNIIFADFVTINKIRYDVNDPMLSEQWYITKTQTDKVWDFKDDFSDVVIGICDSGIKWNHPDLKDNIWLNEAEAANATIDWENGTFTGDGVDNDGNGKVDDVMGWDFYSHGGGGEDNNPLQPWSFNTHGTHVAGCAAAVGNNGIGTIGPAFNAKLINCKGAPDNSDSHNIAGGYNMITYCADLGADIINASWGGQAYSLTYANTYINYATNKGALVVAAAGNDDQEHDSPEGSGYHDAPADCPNSFCVAASDQDDEKASFSDYGQPIDITAPGVAIKATVVENDGWAFLQGTSMASPVVAGICAMVKATHPEFTNVQIRERIQNTAVDIYEENPSYLNKLGAGRVDAFTAALHDLIPLLSVDEFELTELNGNGDGIPNPGEELQLKVKIANFQDLTNAISWANAENTTVTLSSDLAGVTFQDSTADYGTIWGGSNSTNTDDLFQFTTDSKTNTLPHNFILNVKANQDSSLPYEFNFDIPIRLSLSEPNWPFELSGQAENSPLMVDVNSDGTKELVFCDIAGNLHALNSDKTEIANFPVNTGSTKRNICSDGTNIYLVNDSGKAMKINSDGIVWEKENLGMIYCDPCLADINNDGNKEFIIFPLSGEITALDNNGNDIDGFPITSDGTFHPFKSGIADVNGDGVNDIVASQLTGDIRVYDSTTQESIAGFPTTLGGASKANITFANVDDDPELEILSAITVSNSSSIVALNHDGSECFTLPVGAVVLEHEIIAYNIDNDDAMELIFASKDGKIYVKELDGSDYEGFPVNIENDIHSSILLADLDEFDSTKIIVGDNYGYIHAIGLDGQEANNFPMHFIDDMKITGCLGSMESGSTSFAVSNVSGMNLLNLNRSCNIVWGTYRGNLGRTGYNEYSFTGNEDNNNNSHEVVNNSLLNNYPNPFNPQTTISYNLKSDSNVSLNVYNMLGQKVRTLVSGEQRNGSHSVVWNGKDNRGNSVSSGIYFYKLKTDSFTSTKKMVLMK